MRFPLMLMSDQAGGRLPLREGLNEVRRLVPAPVIYDDDLVLVALLAQVVDSLR